MRQTTFDIANFEIVIDNCDTTHRIDIHHWLVLYDSRRDNF